HAARATARAPGNRPGQRQRRGARKAPWRGTAMDSASSGGKVSHPRAAHARVMSRKGEVERRAATGLALCPDPATVPLDDSAHDREADSGALEFLGAVQALKDAEEPLGALRIEARAVVSNRVKPAAFGPLRTVDGNERLLAAAGELQRVGDEVHPDLAQQRQIGLRVRKAPDADLEIARGFGGAQLVGDFPDQGAHVDRALLQWLA